MVITLIGGAFAAPVGTRFIASSLAAPANAASHTPVGTRFIASASGIVGTRFIASANGIVGTSASGDLSVVGPPSLAAATVDAIFSRLGSPMFGTGELVEQTSRQTNVDDAFALAVWWAETNDGAAGVGLTNHNPGGVRGSTGYPSAYDGYTIYPNYSAAIVYWFHMLQNRYVGRGLSTVYAISYPYVGTSNSPHWAGKVVALMLRYRGEAPPPTPTVAPSPTIPPYMLPHHKIVTDPGITRVSQLQTKTQRPSASNKSAVGTRSIASATNLSALSPMLEWLIVVFALLLAFAIALWARSISVAAGTVPNAETPRIFAEPAPDTPVTSPLQSLPRLPSTQGNGTLRRTVLLPSQPDTPHVETPGARPSGLLARYGKTQQE